MPLRLILTLYLINNLMKVKFTIAFVVLLSFNSNLFGKKAETFYLNRKGEKLSENQACNLKLMRNIIKRKCTGASFSLPIY